MNPQPARFMPMAGTSVQLGFGCADLPVRSPREAASLLACAFEHGVRHFDVARLYGYGDGEKVLGDFLRGRRDEVTIATKFGLDPTPWNARTAVRAAAHAVFRKAPPLLRAAQRMKRALRGAPQIAPVAAQSRFNPAMAQSNLETSLRLLQTDFVDLWLLHEASATDAANDGLVEFLERMQQQGKVRAFGVGTAADVLLRDLDRYPPSYTVLQTNSDVLNRAVDPLAARRDTLPITHGSLRSFAECRALVESAPPSAQKRFHNTTGVDLRDDAELARLLLRWAIERNRNGGVLFAARSRERVKRNVLAATDVRLSAPILERFANFLRDVPLGMKAPL